jgi:hypothetical protein
LTKIRGLTFKPHGTTSAPSALSHGAPATPSVLSQPATAVPPVSGISAARSVLLPKAQVTPFTNSLDEVLILPDNGQCGQAIPALEILDNEKSITKHCKGHGLKPRAIAVVLAVFRSKKRSKEIYKGIWDGSKEFYVPYGTPASRLLNADAALEDDADVNKSKNRINALLFAIHFQTLCDSLEHDEKRKERMSSEWKSKETIIMQKIREDTPKTDHQIRNLLKRGRWYGQWIQRLGVGGILILGDTLA